MYKSLLGLMVVVLATTGCGSADSTTSQQTHSSGSGNSQQQAQQVASNFFAAVLASDRNAARAQLTTVAVQRMEALGLDFLLPINESSKFTIGNVEIIEAGMAAVDSVITELASSGKPIREEITIVLRQDGNRWGVVGVVTGMGANEQLDGFNFERPDQPFSESMLDSESTVNIADGAAPTANVPQQAARPTAQDPFRQ